MTTGYGNLGISPLGTYGLGSMGGYGSYDMYMPSSYMGGMNYGLGAEMGMNGSIFGMGGYGMNTMLQYPLMYEQMQAQIETNQLDHAIQMQQGMNRYSVLANRSSDRALIQKIMNNGDVRYYLDNLYQKVNEGDQRGIQEQYRSLREAILNTYSQEFNRMGGNINSHTTANQIIKELYTERFAGANLENDIRQHGNKAFGAGFVSALRGGSHGQYVDQTLQYCFGRNIDQKEGKDTAKGFGYGVGTLANMAEKGAIGAAVGGVVTGIGYGLGKLLNVKNWKLIKDVNFIKNATFGKSLKNFGKAGLITGVAYGAYSAIRNISMNGNAAVSA